MANNFPQDGMNALPVFAIDPTTGQAIGSGATSQQVQGNIAPGATDAGNPVKIGGRAQSSAPIAVADGQRVNAWFTGDGKQTVQVRFTSNSNLIELYDADGLVNLGNSLLGVHSRNMAYNGSTWDRMRGDITGMWTHAPGNTADSSLSNTIATSGTVVNVVFIPTARQEVINPSTSTIWARWGADPVVNGAGSFPIAPGGSFSTDRTNGTLRLLSTAATQPYTVNRYS